MALTSNKIVVAMFGMAAGGYKTLIDDYLTANGEVATVAALLPFSGLDPYFLGGQLYNNEQFANSLVAKLMPGLSTPVAQATAQLIVQYMAQNQTKSRAEVIVDLINALDVVPHTDPTYGAVAKAFDDKVTKADNYTGTSTDWDELAQVVGNQPVQNVGQTFTLTTGVDNIVGTAGNDTINAVVDTANNGGTLGVADVINGGAGTDTMNVTVVDNSKWAQATISGVEKFFFREISSSAGPMDVSNLDGATELWSSKSTQDIEISNIQANATLGLANTGKDFTATFKDGTFKAGSTLALAVDTAGTAASPSDFTVGHALTAGSATDLTLSVVAAAGKSFVKFQDGTNSIGTLKTITLSGTGTVDIFAVAEFNNVTTVNASANSGGVTVALGTNNKDVTITGGSGDDRFVLPNFNTSDKVDGGAGKDTLSVSLADALGFSKAASVSNVEVLELTGNTTVASTLNADFFGVGNIVIDGIIGHSVTLTNLANGATVQLNSDSSATANLTIDIKGAIAGTNDSLTLTTDKNGADLKNKSVTVKAGGVETINVVSSSETGAGAFKLGGITDTQLTTINVSGKGAVDLGFIAPAGITTVNAANASGGVTAALNLSTKAVTFTGGEGADTYVASDNGDTIYGGKGTDSITLGLGDDILVYKAAAESTASAKDTINTFNVTADLIKFDASLLKGTATYLGTGAFTAGGSTELRFANPTSNDLEVDLNGDGTADMVITLTGVTAADFGATNFTFA